MLVIAALSLGGLVAVFVRGQSRDAVGPIL